MNKCVILMALLFAACGDPPVQEPDVPLDSVAVEEPPPADVDSLCTAAGYVAECPIQEPCPECADSATSDEVEEPEQADPWACWHHATLGWMCPVPAGAPWNDA